MTNTESMTQPNLHPNREQKTTPILSFDNISVTGKLADGESTTLISSCQGTVCTGDKISLTGRSGSGKSVLLRAIAGLIPLSKGTMSLFGNPYRQLKPSQWRLQVGLITQHPQMQAGSVLDNLQLPFQFQANQSLKSDTSGFDEAWHKDKLHHFDKEPDFLRQPANRLSGGEQQIVNLLRGLQRHPKLLLLDEPTASLDSTTSTQLIELIQSWHLEHPDHAIIWISHDASEVDKISDTHWLMDAGMLIAPTD